MTYHHLSRVERYQISALLKEGLTQSQIAAKARISAQAQHRSIPEQIEFWSKIGRIAEDNPDLTFTLVQEILAAELEPTVGEYVYL